MSRDSEKYLYFTVGLLKNSFALEALWRDALRYHMVDQPDKLIALRLTEYYELMARGILPPVVGMSPVAKPPAVNGIGDREKTATASSPDINDASSMASRAGSYYVADENTHAISSEMEQNAQAAADYWTLM